MSDEIRIVVKWKQNGEVGEFRRADLVARYLREHLPRILFRADLDPVLKRNQMERATAQFTAGDTGMAFRTLTKEKPDGWDDYYLALNYEVTTA